LDGGSDAARRQSGNDLAYRIAGSDEAVVVVLVGLFVGLLVLLVLAPAV